MAVFQSEQQENPKHADSIQPLRPAIILVSEFQKRMLTSSRPLLFKSRDSLNQRADMSLWRPRSGFAAKSIDSRCSDLNVY
jgi:hypothetical protein